MQIGMRKAITLTACATTCLATNISAQEESSTSADAHFVQPISITGAQPLEFGTIAIPIMGTCLYVLNPDATRWATGNLCQFLEGDTLPASFTLSCAANSLVQFQLIYSDTAPAGSRFAASPMPMAIDGAQASEAYQLRACDADGLSQVTAGGQITLTPAAPHEFSGPVGSIRLEVAYN